MRNIVRWVAVLLGICCLCLGSMGFCEETNLLINASFEKNITDKVGKQQPANWKINTGSALGIVEVITDPAKTHSGSQCLLFAPNDPGKQDAHIYQIISVSSNGKYIFKIWARGKAGDRIKLLAYQYATDNMQFLDSIGSGYMRVSDKWKEFTWEYTPSPKAKIGKVGCAIAVLDGPVYFDDAFFGVRTEESN